MSPMFLVHDPSAGDGAEEVHVNLSSINGTATGTALFLLITGTYVPEAAYWHFACV